MNTNSLKRFAVTARNLLMLGVRNRLTALGFNEDGSSTATVDAVQNAAIHNGILINDNRFADRWNALRDRIASHGVKEVVEEAAYTWFNRLMAIRILEYNSLVPALLDYENPEIRIPRIVTDARAGKTPVLSDEDRASLEAVIGDGRLSFEQFSILIRAYCENNPIIRKCFGGITDYTVLLLPADILAENGFIYLLNKAGEFIEPDDYRKPELIGWLYQFYISEKKDEVFAKKGGYDSDEIPAATQIFTPNWIVKYMVENTLGRIYLDNNPDSALSENWKYFVEPTEPTPDDAILRYDSLEDLKCGDLSCGSGHILNEMFDLLYQLYAEDFYSPREAVEAILTKNMVGIDLDDRARQLAQFALLLKACQTDTAFADGHCMPRIYGAPDLGELTWESIYRLIVVKCQLRAATQDIYDELEATFNALSNAKVLGSIIKFNLSEAAIEYLKKVLIGLYEISESLPHIGKTIPNPIFDGKAFEGIFFKEADPDDYAPYWRSFEIIKQSIRFILALTDKYAALCMNPPYMPTNKEATLKSYAAKEYHDSKSDLFAIFMDVAHDRLREYGKYGMINMQSWMFLSSFESLRKNIIEHQQIDSLLHLGPRSFDELSGEVVQNATFVIAKEKPTYPGIYYRLIDGNNCNAKREMFLAGNNCYVVANQKQFEQVPGAPIAYWVSVNILSKIFADKNSLDNHFFFREGIHTADNARFTRLWYEVHSSMLIFNASSYEDIDRNSKRWVPYNKGGGARKWYGNNDVVIGFDSKYRELMAALKGHVRPSESLYFQAGGTWSSISTKGFALRFFPKGFLFDAGGQVAIPRKGSNIKACLAYLNSNIFDYISRIVMPTINNKCGIIKTLPNLSVQDGTIFNIVDTCINISKQDWDAHETSWNFETSPLLALSAEDFYDEGQRKIQIEKWKSGKEMHYLCGGVDPCLKSLKTRFEVYTTKWEYLFYKLHHNEEELNRKFIDIYGLQDELTPHVDYEDITILQQGEISLYRPTHGIEAYDIEDLDRRYWTILEEEGIVIEPQSRILWNRDVVIKQFISYAVGCMMGRYRLDRPGLAIAHPNPTADEYAPYIVPQTGEQWWIDDDGIVPMMGDDCGFHDNAANRFTEFVRVALGNEYLTENMNFVRNALGKDVVDYFRSDFYTDHKKMYQNRPIYWMFSSNQKGKRAAFQCLVYMHRMNRFTPEHIRTNYLLPYIDRLAAREAELSARSSLSAKENKRLKQLRSDLNECRDYQLRLHEFADRQIEIDLDDGVVKNYATFAPVLAKLK